MVKQFLADFHPTPRPASAQPPPPRPAPGREEEEEATDGVVVLAEQPSYIDAERQAVHDVETTQEPTGSPEEERGRMVDVGDLVSLPFPFSVSL